MRLIALFTSLVIRRQTLRALEFTSECHSLNGHKMALAYALASTRIPCSRFQLLNTGAS